MVAAATMPVGKRVACRRCNDDGNGERQRRRLAAVVATARRAGRRKWRLGLRQKRKIEKRGGYDDLNRWRWNWIRVGPEAVRAKEVGKGVRSTGRGGDAHGRGGANG